MTGAVDRWLAEFARRRSSSPGEWDSLYTSFESDPFAEALRDPDFWSQSFQQAFGRALHAERLEEPTAPRRAAGTYFTPTTLIEPILEQSLASIILERVRQSAFPEHLPDDPLPSIDTWSTDARTKGRRAIEAIRVCDPTSGPGMFLLPAANRLAAALEFLEADSPSPARRLEIRQCVVRHSLFGADIDPVIARAARLALWIWAGMPAAGADATAPGIVAGDSLGTTNAPITWRDPFDVVVGNPPFANAIEANVGESIGAMKRARADLFRELTGTADLAYYALLLADRWTRAEGAVGMVLPRAALNARSARALRERLVRTRPPALIYAPPDPLLFDGANVSVVALVLRQSSHCLASTDLPIEGKPPDYRIVTIDDENWWGPVAGSTGPDAPEHQHRLGDHFEVWAGMTAGMAYDLLPFVKEEPDLPPLADTDSPRLRLTTTGLIDPGVNRWGERTCRYLKHRFERPVIDEEADAPPSLRSRLGMMRRPKVVVAGLSDRVEAYFDREGITAPSVSTYMIFEPTDDRTRLAFLAEHLNGEEATRQFRHDLGSTALSGGRITMTKEFLRERKIPPLPT